MRLESAPPLDGTTTHTDSKATRRPAVVRIAAKVSIAKGGEQIGREWTRVDEGHIRSPPKVAEHTLRCVPMRTPRVFNETTKYPDCVGDVRSRSNRQVEELAYELAVRDILHIEFLF